MARRSLTGRARGDERGYVLVLTALLMVVLLGMLAFSVDVGNWYLTGQQAQRAADAAALGGVPRLPGDKTGAFATAQDLAGSNDFGAADGATVDSTLDGSPTRLKVTVSKTVDNFFTGLFGLPTTKISRTAVADYAGPVPMGSPCNEFGNDPEGDGEQGAACADTGQFWANVGAPAAPKGNGDAYQNDMGSNSDFDPNGYFYAVSVPEGVSNLTFEVFDPALVDVGDYCEKNLDGATEIDNDVVTDAAVRYAKGSSSPYCTGDKRFGGTGQVTTQFTVRDPGGNLWDPTSFPEHAGCQNTYAGFTGNLKKALNGSNEDTYDPYVASVFRQWKSICTIGGAVSPGTYLIQVKSNGVGNDAASGHNRFALRAYSTSDSGGKDAVSVSGLTKMAIYANLPSAETTFYLARVPSGAAGQRLNVRLFDVGDSDMAGQITVVAPEDSGVTFDDCTGAGPASGNLPTCQITANSSFNGKWQTISVPIPEDYSCIDDDASKCWVKLRYFYGAGAQPGDTTSWQASIEGDPVRLVE